MSTGVFFADAIAVFSKIWKGSVVSYIGRDGLETCSEAFLTQVYQQAEKLLREMATWRR